jgi:hypothetical protein
VVKATSDVSAGFRLAAARAAKNILIADVPELDQRLARALAGYTLAFVRTLDGARQMLETSDISLLVTGIHFDDSRMFDLVREVRAHGHKADLPIVCLRAMRLSPVAISSQTLAVTCRALNANAFIDLTGFATEAEADENLRQTVEGLLERPPA